MVVFFPDKVSSFSGNEKDGSEIESMMLIASSESSSLLDSFNLEYLAAIRSSSSRLVNR